MPLPAITQTHTMRKLLPPQSGMERLLFLLKLLWVSTLKVSGGKGNLSPKSPAGLGEKNQVAVIDSDLTTKVLFVKAQASAQAVL